MFSGRWSLRRRGRRSRYQTTQFPYAFFAPLHFSMILAVPNSSDEGVNNANFFLGCNEMQCNILQRFKGTYCFHLQGNSSKQCWLLDMLPLRLWKLRKYVFPKRQRTSTGLCGVTFHKIAIFIASALRILCPVVSTAWIATFTRAVMATVANIGCQGYHCHDYHGYYGLLSFLKVSLSPHKLVPPSWRT